MIIKQAKFFPDGSCLGHYDGKRRECRKECDFADDCKNLVKSGNADAVKSVMKRSEKTVLDCMRLLND
jgi:hypothetical protein